MTIEELKKKLKLLEIEYNLKVTNTKKEFAIVNNPYSIGDTITDHQHTIVIDNIKYLSYSGKSTPGMIYEGFIVLKSGKIGKSRGTIYQENIK